MHVTDPRQIQAQLDKRHGMGKQAVKEERIHHKRALDEDLKLRHTGFWFILKPDCYLQHHAACAGGS